MRSLIAKFPIPYCPLQHLYMFGTETEVKSAVLQMTKVPAVISQLLLLTGSQHENPTITMSLTVLHAFL
jgi:hypothetical protein